MVPGIVQVRVRQRTVAAPRDRRISLLSIEKMLRCLKVSSARSRGIKEQGDIHVLREDPLAQLKILS